MELYECLNETFDKDTLDAASISSASIPENDLDEPEKRTFKLLLQVVSLGQRYDEKENVFCPRMTWNDGRRTFSLEDMSEEDFGILESLSYEKLPLALRARVTDILWVTRRKYPAGIKAAESYLQLFVDLFDPEQWLACINSIRRAITISAQLGKKNELFSSICETAFNKLLELDGNDPLFLSINLIEILSGQRYREADDYLPVADKIIKNAKTSSFIHKVEAAYETKRKLLVWKKDYNAVQSSQIDLARYYEQEADSVINKDIRGLFDGVCWLETCVHIYRNNSLPVESERIQRKLLDYKRGITSAMIPVNMTIHSEGLYQQVVQNLEGLSFQESVIRLLQTTSFFTKDFLREKVLEEQKKYPFKSLFGDNLVDAEGQTIIMIPPLDIGEPEKDMQLLEMHMHKAALDLELCAGETVLQWSIEKLNRDFEFGCSDLKFLVENNPVIPPGREDIFCQALYMGLRGDYYPALHILAPQTENLFRHIAKTAGGLVTTFEDDNTSKSKTLTSVFDIPELVDCYDPDHLFLFKGLMNERCGANIRNEIAHGIMDPGKGNSGIGIYFVCAVLKLCSYTSVEVMKILKNSERLKKHDYDESKVKISVD